MSSNSEDVEMRDAADEEGDEEEVLSELDPDEGDSFSLKVVRVLNDYRAKRRRRGRGRCIFPSEVIRGAQLNANGWIQRRPLVRCAGK